MKYFKYVLLSLAIVTLCGFVFSEGLIRTTPVKAAVETIIGTSTYSTALNAATSTLVYLNTTDAASSTLTAYIGEATTVSVQMCNTASSSSSVLLHSIWFSMATSTWNRTWHQETDAVAGAAGLVSHTPLLRITSSPMAGTTYYCTDELVSPVNARQVMVKFGAGVANLGTWLSIVPQNQL